MECIPRLCCGLALVRLTEARQEHLPAMHRVDPARLRGDCRNAGLRLGLKVPPRLASKRELRRDELADGPGRTQRHDCSNSHGCAPSSPRRALRFLLARAELQETRNPPSRISETRCRPLGHRRIWLSPRPEDSWRLTP